MARKAKINGVLRRELAETYGCRRGASQAVRCPTCAAAIRIEWRIGASGRGFGQVVFHGAEIDHALPEVLGGATVVGNLQLLCRRCNRSKGARHG